LVTTFVAEPTETTLRERPEPSLDLPDRVGDPDRVPDVRAEDAVRESFVQRYRDHARGELDEAPIALRPRRRHEPVRDLGSAMTESQTEPGAVGVGDIDAAAGQERSGDAAGAPVQERGVDRRSTYQLSLPCREVDAVHPGGRRRRPAQRQLN